MCAYTLLSVYMEQKFTKHRQLNTQYNTFYRITMFLLETSIYTFDYEFCWNKTEIIQDCHFSHLSFLLVTINHWWQSKKMKSFAGSNYNRDIFYCHAQSAALFFLLTLLFILVSFLLRRASHCERFVASVDQERRYLNIRSWIHPTRTCTRLYYILRWSRRTAFVWYIIEDVDCSWHHPALSPEGQWLITFY